MRGFPRTPGQVAQLVEQGTENPCVGGSNPSLATILLLGVVLAGCSTDDDCETLCVETGAALAGCLADWPIDWSDLDAKNRRAFRKACQNRWGEERADLEPRELDDALEQCVEGIDNLDALEDQGELCDHLRALYVTD